MKPLEGIIREGIDLKNASITVVEDEETGIPLNIEDLKKGSRFRVRVRPDEDREVSIVLGYIVRDDLTVEHCSLIVRKQNLKPREDILRWMQELDIPKLRTQIADVVTKALKESQQPT